MVWPSPWSSPRISHSAMRLCGSRPAVGSSRKRMARPVHDRPGHHEPLGHAARERRDVAVRPVGEAELLEQRGRPRACDSVGRHPEEAAVEVEVLPHGQRAVERVASAARRRSPASPRWGARRRRCRRRTRARSWGCTRVVSMPAVVVLPAPLGPSRPKISPWCTARSRRRPPSRPGRRPS